MARNPHTPRLPRTNPAARLWQPIDTRQMFLLADEGFAPGPGPNNSPRSDVPRDNVVPTRALRPRSPEMSSREPSIELPVSERPDALWEAAPPASHHSKNSPTRPLDQLGLPVQRGPAHLWWLSISPPLLCHLAQGFSGSKPLFLLSPHRVPIR